MQLKTSLYNTKGDNIGEIELAEKVFGVKVNQSLVHQAVVAQQANERQVLSHTKGRAEVSGGGKKPWKQKGTGRARQGSIRAPQWVGGGVVFGPTKDRNFSQKINLKMKRKAIFMALSDKFENKNLLVLDQINLTEIKTAVFNSILKNLEKVLYSESGNKKIKRSILVINSQKEEMVARSGRNLVGVEIMNLDNINIVDLLKYKNLVLTSETVKKLSERVAK